VEVALQPPRRLVLRGDQPLPGGPRVLDQPGGGQHQPGLRGRIGAAATASTPMPKHTYG